MSKSDFWAGISLITVLNFFFQILLDTITANLFLNTKSRETDVSLSSYHLYIFLWFFFHFLISNVSTSKFKSENQVRKNMHF